MWPKPKPNEYSPDQMNGNSEESHVVKTDKGKPKQSSESQQQVDIFP